MVFVLIYVTDIMQQQGKWREGLSLHYKQREREKEKRKIVLSYLGIKFQPKETESLLKNRASS